MLNFAYYLFNLIQFIFVNFDVFKVSSSVICTFVFGGYKYYESIVMCKRYSREEARAVLANPKPTNQGLPTLSNISNNTIPSVGYAAESLAQRVSYCRSFQ